VNTIKFEELIKEFKRDNEIIEEFEEKMQKNNKKLEELKAQLRELLF
jgi:hypothetical protein